MNRNQAYMPQWIFLNFKFRLNITFGSYIFLNTSIYRKGIVSSDTSIVIVLIARIICININETQYNFFKNEVLITYHNWKLIAS